MVLITHRKLSAQYGSSVFIVKQGEAETAKNWSRAFASVQSTRLMSHYGYLLKNGLQNKKVWEPFVSKRLFFLVIWL